MVTEALSTNSLQSITIHHKSLNVPNANVQLVTRHNSSPTLIIKVSNDYKQGTSIVDIYMYKLYYRERKREIDICIYLYTPVYSHT